VPKTSAKTKLCLLKTLKEGLRRCIYRRWDAEVNGKTLITRSTELERMFRGNTPYPIAISKPSKTNFRTRREAVEALRKMLLIKRKEGFRTHGAARVGRQDPRT